MASMNASHEEAVLGQTLCGPWISCSCQGFVVTPMPQSNIPVTPAECSSLLVHVIDKDYMPLLRCRPSPRRAWARQAWARRIQLIAPGNHLGGRRVIWSVVGEGKGRNPNSGFIVSSFHFIRRHCCHHRSATYCTQPPSGQKCAPHRPGIWSYTTVRKVLSCDRAS